MAGLCEGGNELPGSLKASKYIKISKSEGKTPKKPHQATRPNWESNPGPLGSELRLANPWATTVDWRTIVGLIN
ncbi:hypothetical protein ANN_19537 [Periplaneta americana]|uniref:Uncharacterized protein n=1 Tax=Periplaneta americana TaxID=6978 RepID=A0ABQ8SA66_PERAM|nr:hypothetical protein ANN_19537 [Periplaneta americana]